MEEVFPPAGLASAASQDLQRNTWELWRWCHPPSFTGKDSRQVKQRSLDFEDFETIGWDLMSDKEDLLLTDSGRW